MCGGAALWWQRAKGQGQERQVGIVLDGKLRLYTEFPEWIDACMCVRMCVHVTCVHVCVGNGWRKRSLQLG